MDDIVSFILLKFRHIIIHPTNICYDIFQSLLLLCYHPGSHIHCHYIIHVFLWVFIRGNYIDRLFSHIQRSVYSLLDHIRFSHLFRLTKITRFLCQSFFPVLSITIFFTNFTLWFWFLYGIFLFWTYWKFENVLSSSVILLPSFQLAVLHSFKILFFAHTHLHYLSVISHSFFLCIKFSLVDFRAVFTKFCFSKSIHVHDSFVTHSYMTFLYPQIRSHKYPWEMQNFKLDKLTEVSNWPRLKLHHGKGIY